MLWTLLTLAAIVLMIWYAWSGVALLKAASVNGLSMLWIVGLWQLVSAVAAFFVWRSAAAETLTLNGIIGLIIAATNPVLWSLGHVAVRLRQHGIRLGDVLMLRG